jgi:hypothetical protein
MCSFPLKAAEAEFAFVVAVFGKDQNLFSESLYASIVFAIVLSEIFAPFALQFTLSHSIGKVEGRMAEEGSGDAEQPRTDRIYQPSEVTNPEEQD